MRLFRPKKINNVWVARNQIPLGRIPYTDKVVYKRMPRISDNIIISAMPGRGKSVIGRILIYFISHVRPVIVFDWEGEDHKLSYRPNSINENLPPSTLPNPVPDSVFLCYTNENESWEKQVTPDLTTYDYRELRCLGFAPGAARRLDEIMEKYGPFEDIPTLYKFIARFPTNEKTSKDLYKNRDMRRKHNYELYDVLATQTKDSLMTYLYHVKSQELFRLDKKNYPDIIKYVSKGKNVFLNFKGEVEIARIELVKIMTQVINYRKKYPNLPCPYLFIEEGDRLVPHKETDRDEKKAGEYALHKLIECYKRARKLRLGQCFITPTLSNLNRTIIDLSFEKIFGEMTGQDLKEVKRCAGEYVEMQVSGLHFNRYKNIREFVYRDEFKNTWKFEPFACPQEMHREY